MKSNNINIPKSSNLNLNIKMNKLPYHHFKNKTFDFNSLQPNEHLTKFNTNNNLHNKKIQGKNKINSKFNLIKKPITEVASQIGSPSNKKIDNKINKDKSISHNKDKTKKIFFGLYQYNKSNIINNHKLAIGTEEGYIIIFDYFFFMYSGNKTPFSREIPFYYSNNYISIIWICIFNSKKFCFCFTQRSIIIVFISHFFRIRKIYIIKSIYILYEIIINFWKYKS